jgi:hypothetical protein
MRGVWGKSKQRKLYLFKLNHGCTETEDFKKQKEEEKDTLPSFAAADIFMLPMQTT